MKTIFFNVIMLVGGLIVSISLNGQTTFSKHSIASPTGPIDVATSDVNGDGFQDILTISYSTGEVAWWENNGQAEFSKHVIKTGMTGGRSVRAADIDGDGDVDVLATGIDLNRIEWYENNGSQTFTSHAIATNFLGAHTVEIVDFDQDSDMDILCSGWNNTATKSELAWWENNGSQVFTKHLVSNTLDQSPFIASADFDLDGDLDLVAADETPGEVYWYRNNGQMAFEEVTVDASFASAHTLQVGDVDMDGDPDIMVNSWSGSQAWYENNGLGVFEKHSMQSLAGAMWIDMGDFDLDGDQDIIAVGSGSSRIALYNNDGNQKWTKQNLDGAISSGFGLSIADMDNDHDLDVVAVGYQSNTLSWWENKLNLQSLLNGPAWIVSGQLVGEFYVSNPDHGNVIKCQELEPQYGIASGGYKEGMLVQDDVIWVTSGPMINKYNLESGLLLKQIRTETQFLSSITSDPNGIAYINAPLDGKVFSFNPQNEEFTLLSSDFEYPFAVRYDNFKNELIVLDGEETVTIKTLDTDSGEIQIQNVTYIPAGGDIVPDGKGNYYLSSTSDNRILTFISGLDKIPNIFAEDLQGPWGLWFDAEKSELVVVMNSGNTLERIAATATGVSPIIQDSDMSIQVTTDNIGHLNIQVDNCEMGQSKVFLLSITGQIIKEGCFEVGSDKMLQISWRLPQNKRSDSRPDIYVFGIQSGGETVSKKIAVFHEF